MGSDGIPTPPDPAGAIWRARWVAVFLVALACRGAWWWAAAPIEPNGDERAYVALARSLASGGGFVTGPAPETHVSPLFPTLHSVALRLGGDAVGSGVVLALIVSSLIPVAAGMLVRRPLGETAALVAAAFVAAHPVLIADAVRIQPDGLTALLYLWFASLWLRGAVESAAVVLGLAYLTRPEAFLLAPPWLVVEAIRRRHGAGRLAAAAALFLLVAAPQLAFLRAVTGRWCLSGKEYWVYINGIAQVLTGNRPVPRELLDRLEREVPGVLRHILAEPLEFLRGYLVRWRFLLGNLVATLTLPLVPLSAVGVARCWTAGAGARLLLFPLAVLPVLPVGMTHRHHLITVAPLLVGLAGVATAFLVRRARERWRRA